MIQLINLNKNFNDSNWQTENTRYVCSQQLEIEANKDVFLNTNCLEKQIELNKTDKLYKSDVFNMDNPIRGVTIEECAWIAEQMEHFLEIRKISLQKKDIAVDENIVPYICAHRGYSLAYPENTLEAFEAAAKLQGITGIELDVQLSKDGELVVIHDEKVDRTTNGTGEVRNFTLLELKALTIQSVNGTITQIPTLYEVFTLLEPYCKDNGLLINIELKNSIIRYEGMEQKIIDMVRKFGLEDYIVYSSFLPEAVGIIKKLEPKAKTGTLALSIEQCYKDAMEQNADALHPWVGGMDMLGKEEYQKYPVRVWNAEEPFFGQDRILKEVNMIKYAKMGATDIITNVPERDL